jgi:CheY-like chemotaxis protein
MKKSILVVEDDRAVRGFLKMSLEMQGMEYHESETIGDALAKCAAQRFNLLMLDYNLSKDEVGWSIAREIRGNPSQYGSPKIIGVSGTVQVDAAESLGFSKEDFDAFLQKPFDTKTLRNQIAALQP